MGLNSKVVPALGVALAVALGLAAAPTATATTGAERPAAQDKPVKVTRINPGRLTVGKPVTDLTYLAGNTLHPAGKRARTVKVDLGFRSYLVGKTTAGWVVVGQTRAALTAWRLKRGGGEVIARHTYPDLDYLGFQMSDTGSALIRDYGDRGGQRFTLLDPATAKRLPFGTKWDSSLVGSYQGTLYITDDEMKLSTWEPGEPPVVAEPKLRNVVLVDPVHDLAFKSRKAYGDQVGPTTLSAPDRPAWTQVMTPVAVSSEGTYVVGYTINRRYLPEAVKVFRVDDGSLVADYRLPQVFDGTLAWSDDSTLILQAGKGSRSALVRCTIGGGCERAGGWMRPPSFPNERHVWGPTVEGPGE